MARNLDAKCRQCRREGEKLFLKGEKCFTDKCAVERRSYAPGQHGQKSGAPVRLRHAAARKAEDPPHVRRARAPVPQDLRRSRPPQGRHRREPAAAPRVAPGYGRLPHGLRRVAFRSAPGRAPQRHPGERQARQHPVLPGAPGRRRRSRTEGQGPSAHQGRLRGGRVARLPRVGRSGHQGAQGHVQGAARSAPSCRQNINESLVVELYSK